jgi:hypothetical protein
MGLHGKARLATGAMSREQIKKAGHSARPFRFKLPI